LGKASIDLGNGKKFTVHVKNAGGENVYIQSVNMNGKPYNKNFITHADIIGGAALEFTMGVEANMSWEVGGGTIKVQDRSRKPIEHGFGNL